MRLGERWLNNAERRFGNLAFHGILRWIAGFQFLGFLLIMFSKGFAQAIAFNKAEILSGEVWRVLSWLFLPMSDSPLYLITIIFMFFINDMLEQAVGSFRLNVYVLAMAVFLTIPALSPLSNVIYVAVMPFAFFSSMIFAVGCFFPNYIINLMLVIPIKMKWVAWISAALLLSQVLINPVPLLALINLVLLFFGLLPFLVGIFPSVLASLKNEAVASARRAKFQSDSGAGEGQAFHRCCECGITDLDDPTMEFRVSSKDGNEYCVPCLERSKD